MPLYKKIPRFASWALERASGVEWASGVELASCQFQYISSRQDTYPTHIHPKIQQRPLFPTPSSEAP
ncbi:hypothetical protein [Moorena sp. SIO4G3]|uniref:hypothetical protein n=1 Tax=Moorena sp. SIO4G3 TaxID=2607821 RepID=UPI00142AD29D|nr:hypothetical protein [Moorena sp. SIO4G3]NEO75358.1 hypothetical protein [Moorena sp. SIO4G3]